MFYILKKRYNTKYNYNYSYEYDDYNNYIHNNRSSRRNRCTNSISKIKTKICDKYLKVKNFIKYKILKFRKNSIY